MASAKGPYNLPPGERGVDNLTYNPMADASPDNAAYEGTNDDFHSVGARGADNQPSFRDAGKEDLETERSDATGRIPRSEVNELLDSATSDERNAQGRTRGNKVDAFRQERDLDRAFDESGVADADQDIEVGATTGR
ncbi:uncharacterized protein B0H18DRAFT_1084509 [Fomitopsis serialis]|uniref:uncharacterized protein n=1 Tax=Fomitopsis serialis TaxID=139415 RepID=UPI00200731E6|nr:uncharacterized protein B0H18DRAFT_1084509 [Neoantrodia serialis]KAH9928338.1 hypothetical protein B0H18DRAFT_1084509 [Neoantrodia serialis]